MQQPIKLYGCSKNQFGLRFLQAAAQDQFTIVNCVSSGDVQPSLHWWAASSGKGVGEQLGQPLLQWSRLSPVLNAC